MTTTEVEADTDVDTDTDTDTDTASKLNWLKAAQLLSTKPWRDQVLPLDKLKPMVIDTVDKGYQRPLSEARVAFIRMNFDAGEARALYVSSRTDGTMWILDGQHTHAALLSLGITEWPCRVFYNLTIEEEARRFAEYQSNSRPIPAVVRWNAEVISGNEKVVAIEEILSQFYLRISTTKIRSRDGYLGIGSRAVPEKIYDLGGARLLTEVYQLATDAWGQAKESYLGRVLQGMGYLLAFADGEFDRTRLLAVLKNTTPKQIVEAVGATGSGGATRSGALFLMELYIDGVAPAFPRIRKNTSSIPKLPEKAPRDGPDMEREFYTAETHDSGRTVLAPMEIPDPVPSKEEKAAAKAVIKAEKKAAADAVAAEKVAALADAAEAEVDSDEVLDAMDSEALDASDDPDVSDEDFSYPSDAVEAQEV